MSHPFIRLPKIGKNLVVKPLGIVVLLVKLWLSVVYLSDSLYFCANYNTVCSMIQENFIKIYEKSFKKNWELPALTDYSKGTTFSFADVAKEIARIHILFEECQIGGEIRLL